MNTLPPGRLPFDTPLALSVWAADQGVLDDTWLDAIEPMVGGVYLLRFRHRLLWMEAPPGNPP